MLSSLISFFVIGRVKLILTAALTSAILILVIVCLIRRRFLKMPILLALFSFSLALGAVSSYFHFDVNYADMRKYDGEEHTVRALVTESRYYSDYGSAYSVRIISVDGEPKKRLAYLSCEYGSGLMPGDFFEIHASLDEPRDDTFGYSRKISMLSDGITSVIISESEEDYTVLEREMLTPEVRMKLLNAELSARLSRIVGGEAGELASAMFLADRSGLSEKTELDFSRGGTSHLLALSGLHMAIVAAIAEFFLQKLRVKRSLRCVLLGALLLFYLALVGFALSAVRSVIMVAVVYLAYILRSPADSRTSLFFAGFLILLVSPSAVCDIGFWMSFFATFGIVIVSPYIGKLFSPKRRDGTLKIITLRVLKYLISAITVTVTANLSVLFFSWLFFGQVSLIAPLTNLLLAPLSSALIFLSMLTLILYFPLPAIAEVSAHLAELTGELILDISAYFSEFRGIALSLEYDFAGIIICLFAVSTLILLIVKLKHRLLVLLPTAVAALAFCICLGIYSVQRDGILEISYLRQKDGEILVLSERGAAVAVDVSEGYYSRFSAAAALVHEHSATELEVLILTHYHSRQSISLQRLFDSCKTRAIWLPEPQNEYDYRELCEILSIAEDARVASVIYRYGEEMTLFGDAELTVFPYRKLDRSVEAQVGFSIRNGGRKLTYIGSAYFEGDAAPVARSEILSAEHLVLGCHGPSPKKVSSIAVNSGADIVLADADAARAGLIRLRGADRGSVILQPEYARFTLAPAQKDQ